MGRFLKRRSFYQMDKDILKIRHRNADTKYRSKVQFLYSKLKEMVKTKTAKDGLMAQTLSSIMSLETEIIDKVGENRMKYFKDEFLEFLHREDLLWKREKDLNKWWYNVERCLSEDCIHPNLESTMDKSSSGIHNRELKQPEIKRLVYLMKIPKNVAQPYKASDHCMNIEKYAPNLTSFDKNCQNCFGVEESKRCEIDFWNPPNTQFLMSNTHVKRVDIGDIPDGVELQKNATFDENDLFISSSQESFNGPIPTGVTMFSIAPFTESSIRHL